MNWFQRTAMKRAAWVFARRLPAQLQSGWGRAKVYTPGQVAAALSKLRLGGRYVAIAYAAFVTEEDYATIAPDFPFPMTFEDARATYGVHYAPWLAHINGPISNADAAVRHGWLGL